MSDGETVEEAIANGRAALRDCLEVFKESGWKAPPPGIEAAQWRQRLPRTLYLKLTEQAKREGVSINSPETAIIAEAIGARQKGQSSATRGALALKGSMKPTKAEALLARTRKTRANWR